MWFELTTKKEVFCGLRTTRVLWCSGVAIHSSRFNHCATPTRNLSDYLVNLEEGASQTCLSTPQTQGRHANESWRGKVRGRTTWPTWLVPTIAQTLLLSGPPSTMSKTAIWSNW